MIYLIALRQRCIKSVIIFCGLQITSSSISEAQDLSGIDKKKPIKITGGINATQTAYSARGIENRRDPYYWMLNANLNFDIFGIYIPFSATVSQQNKSFTQPFNQYGISPKYKSVTAHLGYRSMQYSTFSLAGNIFLGGGVEIAPSKSLLKFSSMYGRFSKAVSVQENEGLVSGQPAFERWGYGSKLTFGNQSRNIDLILFHGQDKASSIPGIIADSFKIKPAENLVLGVNTRQSISKKITFDMEYALSAYTEDTRLESSEVQKYKLVNKLGPFFTANISSQFNKAILGNITYTDKLFQFRIAYRRIDPEFKTMGSVFLNNDLEDITGSLAWRMLKNKMNMSVGSGVQRNNLDDVLSSGMNRFLGSVNCSYIISKKLNMNVSYSNFTSNTKINNSRISMNQLGLIQNMDSLKYNQITNSANGGINYNTGNKTIKHIMFCNGGYQKANDNHGNGSVFYNVISGYQFGFIPIGLNITFSANYNNSIIKEMNTKSLGPNLSLSKMLFKKIIRSTLSLTHLKTFNNAELSGTNTMFRFSNSLKMGKHHNISADITLLHRNIQTGSAKSFSESRGSLIYGYTF
jgi:hypothetical protein